MTRSAIPESGSLLFVYGSLKEGFPNFHVNGGRRVPGRFRTVHPHPLYLADGVLPCLLPAAGQGHRVAGQLFEVGAAELARMDRLEKVGEPGGYERVTIEVERDGNGDGDGDGNGCGPVGPWPAFVYVQHESRLAGTGPHIGPIEEYTHEHAKNLRWSGSA